MTSPLVIGGHQVKETVSVIYHAGITGHKPPRLEVRARAAADEAKVLQLFGRGGVVLAQLGERVDDDAEDDVEQQHDDDDEEEQIERQPREECLAPPSLSWSWLWWWSLFCREQCPGT